MNNSLMIVLIALEKPRTKYYKDINAVWKVHFKLKPVIIDKWFKFQWRNQGAKETIAEYIIVGLWTLTDRDIGCSYWLIIMSLELTYQKT